MTSVLHQYRFKESIMTTRPPVPRVSKASKALRLPKVPARFMPVMFAFYMSAIMAVLMSSVIVAINTGVGAGYFKQVAHAYSMAMPVAFLCVMGVRPLVMRLVALTVASR
ncbi:DUF2798 domain-containing protein [Methylobacillus flagellatus]|uniref:DUF2798 domain-containing protein n=1 Tax=Methylobacillus flagellatus TaxID=405 RepID=UPI00336A1EC0